MEVPYRRCSGGNSSFRCSQRATRSIAAGAIVPAAAINLAAAASDYSHAGSGRPGTEWRRWHWQWHDQRNGHRSPRSRGSGREVVADWSPQFQKRGGRHFNGAYAFTHLAPGTYTLTITAPNFTQKVFSDTNATAGSPLPLQFHWNCLRRPSRSMWKPGNRVMWKPRPRLYRERSSRRKWSASNSMAGTSLLIALAPGVSNQTGQDEGKVGVVGSVKYSVNGGRVEYNSFEIDGSDVLNTGLNRSASSLVV